MLDRYGRQITLERRAQVSSFNTLTVGSDLANIRGYAHADHPVAAFGDLSPLTIAGYTVWEFLVGRSGDTTILDIGYPNGGAHMSGASRVGVTISGFGQFYLAWDDIEMNFSGSVPGLFDLLDGQLDSDIKLTFEWQEEGTATLTANSVRMRQDGLAGSAMQDELTYRIKHSEISATALSLPKPKDKLTDAGQLRTVNKVEQIWEGETLAGWRLRCGGS